MTHNALTRAVSNDRWTQLTRYVPRASRKTQSAMIIGGNVSASPAPMPFRTQAPMNELYVLALARQMQETKQTRLDSRAAGRRPNCVATGTQRKLLKPKTRLNNDCESRSYDAEGDGKPDVGNSSRDAYIVTPMKLMIRLTSVCWNASM